MTTQVATQYRTEKYKSHSDLEKGLNELAREGWQPIHYAIQSGGGGIGAGPVAHHYVILAR